MKRLKEIEEEIVNVYIYPQADFPYLDRYKEVFPVTDDTIFAYNNAIYCNNPLPDHLLVHEITHIERQNEQGVEEWVNKYLTDPEFRLIEEMIAVQAEINSVKDRNQKYRLKLRASKVLSSPLYGNMVTAQEVMKMLSRD